VNDGVEAAAAGTPHIFEMDPVDMRAARRAQYVYSARREDLTIPGAGPSGNELLKISVWRPLPAAGKPRGVYLLYHGGGFVFGDAAVWPRRKPATSSFTLDHSPSSSTFGI